MIAEAISLPVGRPGKVRQIFGYCDVIGKINLASHIDKELLEEMFADVREKATLDIGGDMLWGYFFTGPNARDLKKIGAKLAGNGYRLVDIRELEPDAPDEAPEWQLHVEQVESHTVDSLDARNTQLEELASQYEDVIYDGMDVGPVE